MKVAANAALSLARCASVSSAGLSARSTLLSTSTFGWRSSASRPSTPSASSSIPFLASISSAAMSASCAPLQAVVTMARSSRRRGAKMPGVSMNTSWAAPSVAMPRTSARVVCTLRLTIDTLEPTSALISVDLPALGAPISAMKPQRVSPSTIRRHAFAGEHRGGSGLLGGALGGPDALGRRTVGDLDRDAEFRIVVRPGALDLAIGGRRQAAALRPFLQHGLRVAQRTRRLEHALAPESLDQLRGCRIAAVDEHRADQRLAGIRQSGGAPPPARVRLRIAKFQCGAEVDRARDIGAGVAAHQVREAPREIAFVPFGKRAIEHVGNDETEHVVAQEFQPLIAAAAALTRRGRDVGERAVEIRLVGEDVTDPSFEFVACLWLSAHRTIVNSLVQRTTHGQRHTFHAASPSTEKKMISARPTMLSNGT